MKILNLLSLILFLIFIISYSLKLIILYKRNNLRANTLGKGVKDRNIKLTEITVKTTTFIWGLTWIAEIFFNNIISQKLSFLFKNKVLSYIGLLTITIGVLIFIIAMINMKSSWRVGIDKINKSELITNGIYKYSRNPAFVGFYLMFLGLFFIYQDYLTLIVLILNIISIHKLILQEEKHLEKMFHKEYLDYKKRTPRYIGMKK
ncbi:phospholipid methyltransferase [Gottschalkia purinilytica]|uniref:Phospholipid methyltransferase n=1 Tax=Gottschalkia purinilytica TaxID=1503 RepID=A0A0L0WAX6_GOTPU|nr:isoprenylcysteine carboxylmethyltransferase family protein [Gottschalkia purinilytica]KNF08656.1 phospholipid methyltransferase [Gottschalkia purinilytica]